MLCWYHSDLWENTLSQELDPCLCPIRRIQRCNVLWNKGPVHPFYSPPQTPHPLIINHLWMGPEISCLSRVSCLLSIKLPMYPVVYMGLDVWIWMGENPFLRSFEGVGPEISTFLGQNGTRYARTHFRAQKSLDFRAHLFKRPPSKSIHPAPYKKQAH